MAKTNILSYNIFFITCSKNIKHNTKKVILGQFWSKNINLTSTSSSVFYHFLLLPLPAQIEAFQWLDLNLSPSQKVRYRVSDKFRIRFNILEIFVRPVLRWLRSLILCDGPLGTCGPGTKHQMGVEKICTYIYIQYSCPEWRGCSQSLVHLHSLWQACLRLIRQAFWSHVPLQKSWACHQPPASHT